jgi:hypothetical protein
MSILSVDTNKESSPLQHRCENLKSRLLLLGGRGGRECPFLAISALRERGNLDRAFVWGLNPERFLTYWLQALGTERRSR